MRGRMWPKDEGVDIACSHAGRMHTLRFRYCLDADLRVRLFVCGVVDGAVARAEVVRDRVVSSSPAHARLIRACMANARPVLAQALQRYVAKFTPRQRQLLRF